MAATNGTHSGINRVLVIGDNYAGSSIIKALNNTSNFDVHVAHPHAPSQPTDGATYHTHDLSQSLTPLLSNLHPDLVISTASGGSFEAQKAIIDSAIEAGIPRFIPSEFGQDSLNEGIQQRLPPSRERARTIQYLQQQQSRSISWVAVASGTTLDRGLLSGTLGFDLKWQSATMHGQGHERFAASSSPWIGRVVLAVIERWEDFKNQYLYASGVTTSADEMVGVFEKATGKGYEVGRADVQQCVHEAERRLEQGFPDAGMFLMERSVLYDERLDAVRPFEVEDAKRRLGLEGESVEEIIRGVLHDHEHHGGAPGCGCD